jgi:hypothetical protein
MLITAPAILISITNVALSTARRNRLGVIKVNVAY